MLEPIYHKCVRRECELLNMPTQYELIVPIEYKGFVFEEPPRLDVLIDEQKHRLRGPSQDLVKPWASGSIS